jgi:hypothetical protein
MTLANQEAGPGYEIRVGLGQRTAGKTVAHFVRDRAQINFAKGCYGLLHACS